MDRISITLTLPAELVKRAKSAGLLTDEHIEEFLAKELDRQQGIDSLFADIDKLVALEPKLTQEEINAEIEAHHREKQEQDRP